MIEKGIKQGEQGQGRENTRSRRKARAMRQERLRTRKKKNAKIREEDKERRRVRNIEGKERKIKNAMTGMATRRSWKEGGQGKTRGQEKE